MFTLAKVKNVTVHENDNLKIRDDIYLLSYLLEEGLPLDVQKSFLKNFWNNQRLRAKLIITVAGIEE